MLTRHVNRTAVVFSLVLGVWTTVAIADDRADFDQAYATSTSTYCWVILALTSF